MWTFLCLNIVLFESLLWNTLWMCCCCWSWLKRRVHISGTDQCGCVRLNLVLLENLVFNYFVYVLCLIFVSTNLLSLCIVLCVCVCVYLKLCQWIFSLMCVDVCVWMFVCLSFAHFFFNECWFFVSKLAHHLYRYMSITLSVTSWH